ncbi:MAG: zinc-binding dehydrogenase, partial [Chloroflexota bacterium]
NYRDQDYVQEVRALTGKRGVDVVVEHVGEETWEKSVACLARMGRLVTCGSMTGDNGRLNLWSLFAKEISIIGSYGGSRADLTAVLQLVAQGRLRPVIHSSCGLEGVPEAHHTMESREHFGKLIVNP